MKYNHEHVFSKKHLAVAGRGPGATAEDSRQHLVVSVLLAIAAALGQDDRRGWHVVELRQFRRCCSVLARREGGQKWL